MSSPCFVAARTARHYISATFVCRLFSRFQRPNSAQKWPGLSVLRPGRPSNFSRYSNLFDLLPGRLRGAFAAATKIDIRSYREAGWKACIYIHAYIHGSLRTWPAVVMVLKEKLSIEFRWKKSVPNAIGRKEIAVTEYLWDFHSQVPSV